jgi:hypothetical protein
MPQDSSARRDSSARIEAGISDPLLEDVRAAIYDRLNIGRGVNLIVDATVEIIVTQLRAHSIGEPTIRGALTGPAAIQGRPVRASNPVLINCGECGFTHISSKTCHAAR